MSDLINGMNVLLKKKIFERDADLPSSDSLPSCQHQLKLAKTQTRHSELNPRLVRGWQLPTT